MTAPASPWHRMADLHSAGLAAGLSITTKATVAFWADHDGHETRTREAVQSMRAAATALLDALDAYEAGPGVRLAEAAE